MHNIHIATKGTPTFVSSSRAFDTILIVHKFMGIKVCLCSVFV